MVLKLKPADAEPSTVADAVENEGTKGREPADDGTADRLPAAEERPLFPPLLLLPLTRANAPPAVVFVFAAGGRGSSPGKKNASSPMSL